MPSVSVRVTVDIKRDSATGYWVAKKVKAKPDKAKVKLGQGSWTVSYALEVGDRGGAKDPQLWFARNESGWGNVNPIVFKSLTEADISFPSGWSSQQKQAFLAQAQTALNAVTSVPSNSNRAEAAVTFDPGTLEGGQELEIHLPYTIDFFINVEGTSYGPTKYDPEVDLEPET
jgi:hypothetical protein